MFDCGHDSGGLPRESESAEPGAVVSLEVGCGFSLQQELHTGGVPHGCGSEEWLLQEILGEKAMELLRKGNEKIVAKF